MKVTSICRLLGIWLFAIQLSAQGVSFTNLMAQGEHSEEHGDIFAAIRFYDQAEQLESNNAPELCGLVKKYCDLMFLTDSITLQTNLLVRATACARQAVEMDSQNSIAHASLAVCYAKACAFAGLKDKITYSRAFKEEAGLAIRLDPHNDAAYYLLGRWNSEVAGVGLLSRTYLKMIYGGLPRASNEEAIKYFQKAITLAPGHALYYAGLAHVYETTGQKTLALTALRKCVVLKPLDRNDQYAKANALKELGLSSQ